MRRGCVSAAAQAIGIGQPTASQHLRVLERAAGRQLVERNGKGSRLTEAGHVIAARAAEALHALELADEELRGLDGLVAGTIHLGASTAPGAYLLPDVLGCFRREYPGVTVEVEVASSGEILRRLLEGRVQLGVVGAQTADPKIVLEPFLEDEIVGIARPGLLPLVDGKLAPAEIESLTLLSRESGSSSRDLVEAELRAARV